MKEGEEKNFELPFPKDHVQKMLAGKDVGFEIKVKEVYHLESPKLDDEFAKALGQKDFDTLKKLITENLKQENESEERFRQEKEMLELQAKLKAREEREKALPIAVRKDKYMVALTSHLKKENYQEALVYFAQHERLNVELPSSFTFFSSEALLRTGKPK